MFSQAICVFNVHFFHILIFTCYYSIILHASYSLSQVVRSSDTHGNFESGANFRHVNLLAAAWAVVTQRGACVTPARAAAPGETPM